MAGVELAGVAVELVPPDSGQSLTVGTSLIEGGANGRVLYDNNGVLGEMTTTGSGTVLALATAPTLVTPVLGVAVGTSLALGGATIGANALAATGTGNISGVLTVASATATPAHGSTAARLVFGTTSGFGIYYGSDTPTVSAAKGSLYLRSDGSGIADRAYINTDGSTTWTAIATAG